LLVKHGAQKRAARDYASFIAPVIGVIQVAAKALAA
jgi:hypothetical protein